VYTFTKLHDRRIPNVGVGVCVGPVGFQLNVSRVNRAGRRGRHEYATTKLFAWNLSLTGQAAAITGGSHVLVSVETDNKLYSVY